MPQSEVLMPPYCKKKIIDSAYQIKPPASRDEEQMEREVSMDVSSSPPLPPSSRETEAIAPIEVEEFTERDADHSVVAYPHEVPLGAATNEQTSASPRTDESGALTRSPDAVVEAQDEDEAEEQDEDYEATVDSPQLDKAETEDAETAAQQSESEERQPFSREEETTDAASHESTPAPPVRECKLHALRFAPGGFLNNCQSSAERRSSTVMLVIFSGTGRG